MKFLDKQTSGDLVKLVIFILVTTLSTGVLFVLIGNFTFQSSRDYKAVFSDATGVSKGDDVRIAGVKVGSVKSVDIVDRSRAMIGFTVAKVTRVTKSSEIQIRYRNLVGQRYLSLSQGVGDTAQQPSDSVIPESRTQPALDLTVLFNGFKPLFAALSPSDINKLSYSVVQVFQGEGGNLEQLLTNTASITNTLADRDQLIGDLIDNLNSVLTTVNGRDTEFSRLIINLRTLLTGLNGDKQAILGSLDGISQLALQTADLSKGIRPPLVSDVKQLRRLATNLNTGRPEIDRALQVLPIKLKKIGRTAIQGSFFDFYLCQLEGTVKLPTALGQLGLPTSVPLKLNTNNARCNLS